MGDRKVKVMRDPGATVCVVRRKLVRQHEFTGRECKLYMLNGSLVAAPEARIKVSTPFYTGYINAASLQAPLYDLVIGNIRGARNGPAKDAVTQTPSVVSSEPSREEDIHAAAAVVTRSAAKRKDVTKPLVVQSVDDLTDSEEVRREVKSDPTLASIRRHVMEGSQVKVGQNTACFEEEKGLLYRKVAKVEGESSTQLVVPARFRQSLLKLTYSTTLGGHLGCVKTRDRLQPQFYWPGIGQDVTRFVRSCDVCQRTSDKGRIKPAPLQPLPIIDSAFERVAVDIVGPIEPRASDGSRYILTMVDFATRWPEAQPLRNIEAATVADAMLSIFSRVGFPKQVLSDRGSQFTSGMMDETLRLIACQGLHTTPYHPAGNGLCEKFNGTLKKMLKRMVTEQPKEWHRYIAPLLFAYREVPQTSTRFAPFELVYGRAVRGPLHVLRELWDDKPTDPEVKTTYQYVLDLSERLKDTCNLAKQELLKAREVQKKFYDRRTKLRKFAVDEQVLVLLPTATNKLLAQWKGPYKVLERVNDLNYILSIDNQPRRFHINMLKKYVTPEAAAGCVATVASEKEKLECLECVAAHYAQNTATDVGAAVVITDESDEEGPVTVACCQTESQHDVKLGADLEPEQRERVTSLLAQFSDVLSDKPGKAHVAPYHIQMTSKTPIRVKPYQIPLRLTDAVKAEIREMEAAGIIEKSDSPYASPIVVVKKKEGGVRVCGDYRRVNAVVEPHAEPMFDVQAIFATLANSKIFSRLDLTKGYFQVPLTAQSKKVTAISTPLGLFQYNSLPFGLANSPAAFNQVMREVMRDVEGVEVFVDDVLVHSSSFEQHMQHLEVVLERLRRYNLTIKPSKCLIGHVKLPFLGHVIGDGQYGCQLSKIAKVRDAPRPQNKTQVKSFLGLAGYYRDFVPNYAVVAEPLTELLKKRAPNTVQWTSAQQEAFDTLKSLLCKEPILRLPDASQPFVLRTDASQAGVGAVLLQEHNGELYPVSYFSRKLRAAEINYSTVEKELLAVVEGVKKYYFYLYGDEFLLETDHMPLASLRTSKNANARLTRWALYLQQFRFTVRYIKGKSNVGADFLSRLIAE